MRVYNIWVNADLVECIDPNIDEWNELHKTMHTILEIECMLGMTGSIPSAVKDRGHAGKFWEFMQ